jgi:uncharacterized protein
VNQKIISEIWLYPIKSLSGIKVDTANVLGKGLEGDRRFMLVDENNTFMTQRVFPQMALFSVSMEGKTICVKSKSKSQEILIIPHETQIGNRIKTHVWNNEIEVVEANPTYSQWFSEALKMNCKLVYFPEENPRRVDPKNVKDDHHVSLADAYPYLIIGNQSLSDLNQRVGSQLSMRRFRPNFVFDGTAPYEEDEWEGISIGSVKFAGVKPCGRCALPNVDPDSGEKGEEPLRTLALYRRQNGNIIFGLNVIALNYGTVRKGDEIILS